MPASAQEERPNYRAEPKNNSNEPANMAQQMQLLQLLSQMGGGGINPLMLAQLMNGMNGGKR